MNSSLTSSRPLEKSRLFLLTEEARTAESKVSQLEGQRTLLKQQIVVAERREEAARARAALREDTLDILQALEANWRRGFEEALASLVSHGLTAVFGEPVTITIETTVKRDTTSMRLLLQQGDVVMGDIVDGTGGSIVSVLSVLLHVLFVVSSPLRRIVVLDEPFAAVADNHIPALGSLLRELSERLDMQFIIVSHEEALMDAADVVYEVLPGGTVRQIKKLNEERL